MSFHAIVVLSVSIKNAYFQNLPIYPLGLVTIAVKYLDFSNKSYKNYKEEILSWKYYNWCWH